MEITRIMCIRFQSIISGFTYYGRFCFHPFQQDDHAIALQAISVAEKERYPAAVEMSFLDSRLYWASILSTALGEGDREGVEERDEGREREREVDENRSSHKQYSC